MTAHQGLTNYGNTCYFNAIMQVLARLPDFYETLIQDTSLYFNVLKDLMLAINQEKGKSVSQIVVNTILENIYREYKLSMTSKSPTGIGCQGDPIDILHSFKYRYFPALTSFVNDKIIWDIDDEIFTDFFKNNIMLSDVHINLFKPFFIVDIIELNINGKLIYYHKFDEWYFENIGKTGASSIQELINEIDKKRNNDLIDDPILKAYKYLYKKDWKKITTLYPKILLVCINYSEGGIKAADSGLILDTDVYNLKSKICKSGPAEGGHYWSYINLNNKWIEFDDSAVTQIDESKLTEGVSRMLIYEKV